MDFATLTINWSVNGGGVAISKTLHINRAEYRTVWLSKAFKKC